MRTIFLLGRFCCRHSGRYLRHRLFWHESANARYASRYRLLERRRNWRTLPGSVILGALSPAAFVQISEQEDGNGETAEERMLVASRAEIAKVLPDDIHGFQRFRRSLSLFFDLYIIEPIATGFRFLHLVAIFVPVILSIPAIWVGSRQKERDNERSGTIWWYHFLVNAMERAGPAFIKVE